MFEYTETKKIQPFQLSIKSTSTLWVNGAQFMVYKRWVEFLTIQKVVWYRRCD